MVRLKYNKAIIIIDTTDGGICYNNTKLMFILIPRSISIEIPNAQNFINALQVIQSMKPSLSSNRGKRNRVLFEISNSNYVDLSIGVSRFFPGIYKKSINEVSKSKTDIVETYFGAIENICKNYLPNCLINKLDQVLNDIQMDNFDEAKTFKEKIGTTSNENTCNINGNMNKFSCMPSTSFGINNFLPMHRDKDMFLSVVHVHSNADIAVGSSGKYNFQSDIVKYFTFDNGISIGLRSGDLLIFNPIIDHCISASTEKYMSKSNYCISHYFKTAVASRNNNSIKFEYKK